jgi:ribosome-associated protein
MSHPAQIEVAPEVLLPRAALKFTFSRSGGPGGQNVNKVSSRVQLRVAVDAIEAVIGGEATERLRVLEQARVNDAGELMIESDRSRSQLTNRRVCIEKLGALIVQARRVPRVRRTRRISRAAHQRRIDAKTHRARIKKMRRSPHDDT